ncbi:amino acid adenylation domain-containing protein [Actinomadura sp. B10D3]|uniref:amino acid adenylation domain-containing protein n=1 Tax=Actinomadura sp. B10D3 TaxID=3153557 RepID=UPI00325ECB6C
MSIDENVRDAAALREDLLRRRLRGGGRTGRRTAGIGRADRARPLPLSYGQQQMWFLHRLEPDSAEYLVPLVLRMRGPIEREPLERAWRELIVRHEILRTRYAMSGGAPVQIIDEPRDLPPLREADLSGHPAGEREERADGFLARETATPFDLERQWPVRGTLVRLSEDDHVLVVVFHHIACDAWSCTVFGSELAALYRAFAADGPAPLPPLPVQYADFAAWQRRELAGDALEDRLAHWRERLAGIAPLDLPTDRPRPAVRDHAGAEVPFDLPAGLGERVRDLAARHDTTPFVVFLTAFQVLLARYTGRQDVPVGTVVSGRTRPELQGLIGYGINSLVMRAAWTGDPAFADLLDRGRAMVLDAYDHQEVPFARLVDELQPERDMSRTPLYQVAFTLHGERNEGVDLPGVRVEEFGSGSGPAKCDLELQIQEHAGGGFSARMRYASALFEASTVQRMSAHFRALLEAALAEPATPVSRLEMLDGTERAAVLAGPAARPPVERCVHELFEERAAAAPDAIAVVAGAERLTYAQVNARANRLAHHLRSLGMGPESLVGVCLERGPELIPTLLGVLKSGAGYVPLDPVNPAERLAHVAADAGVAVIVTRPELLDLVGEVHGGTTVVVGRDEADAPDGDPANRSVPDNAIYVIYTSGSTGRPKGVALTHANVVRLMTTAHEHYGFGAADVWSLFHSYAFDVSVFEMWGALLFGGTLVVVPREVTRSPEDFLDLLADERVTVLSQTPTAFRGLVAAAADGDERVERLALRAVVFAGEKLETAELRPWADRRGLDAPALVNMYGITETTVHSTYHRLTGADLDPAAGNRIGRPLADLAIRLLDPHGHPVPVGVPGEIHVAGPGVARGYLNRPDLTAERFVPDPFGPPGSRMYRSGDLARRTPDGGLEFLGRADDQVKVRGYRVEPGEIEAALTAHPAVRQAVVVVRDERLVGYLVPAEGAPDGPPDAPGLRALLARTLPDYMIPAVYVPLARIPLTPNGKLDKRALPDPGDAAVRARGAYAAPRTPGEAQVAAVWADVLGVERVGILDGFFELGGDSISAVALVGELRARGLDVSVRDVFAHRTVAALAELAGGRPALPAADTALVRPFELISDRDRAALPDGVADAYPLSQNQIGMLVEMLAEDGRNAYHNVTLFRINDGAPFDEAAFRAAGELVVARHEALRTSIHLTGYSVPMQLVHAAAELPMGVHDLTALTGEEADRALAEFSARERAALFDLGTPALMRFHAHLTGDGGFWMAVTECHPILEGWSHHSLLMELLDCYRAIRDGRDPEPYEAPAVRFADFIAAERASLESAEDREYWDGVVGGHARFTLPAAWSGERPAPDGPGPKPSEKHLVGVPWHDLEDGLRALATDAGASLKSVLVAAYTKVMSQLTEEPAFHVGLVCDARPEILGADRVYGMYLNTLPFPVDRGARTWRELVRRTFEREVELWPHRRHPFPEIQRRAGGRRRLIDVYFNYQDFHQVDTALVDDRAGSDDAPTEFPLTISSRVGHVILTADSHHLTLEDTDRLGAMFRAVLEAMAAGPDGDAREILLPPGERDRTLREWAAGPAAAAAADACAMIGERAARTPHAVAVTGAAGTVTYAELWDRAGRIAGRLRGLGAGPETVVGVLLGRGPDLPASMLGVWRAGAAYAPMDPSDPPGRLHHVLADSGARVVLTEEAYEGLLEGAFDGTRLRAAEAARESTAPGPVVRDPDSTAYVIYTSGSTGRPKGVRVTHRGLAGYLDWAAAEYIADPGEGGHAGGAGGAPLFSSVAFDLAVTMLYAPLVAGRPVHMFPQDGDLADLGDWLAANGPFDFVKLTPSHLEMLAHQLGPDRAAGLAGTLVAGGEPLHGPVAGLWSRRLGGGRVVNEYGPTEATVADAAFTVEDPRPEGVVPVGRPIPGTTLYVLDELMEPVPVGVVGELYVGGAGLARGYSGDPAMTAERFVPDPFGRAGGRLYATGDLARWRSDGDAEVLGRRDGQVKIRGHRVEPGEVAAVLREAPDVRDAVVVAGADGTETVRLVAYVVTDGAATDAAFGGLREHCAALLPEHMVPRTFVSLDRIPLTTAGKLDERALPAPDRDTAVDRPYTAPRTPVEERVAALWGDVLGVGRVGVDDAFFDLGGDSIRAVVLAAALRAEGFEVGVRDVMEHRTVAGLCARLARRDGAAPAAPRPAVAPFELVSDADRTRLPRDVVDAYPLSQNQAGMLVEMLADGTRNSYVDVTSFRIRSGGPFSPEAFRRAVAAVAGRHDVLRSSLHLDGYSTPMQLVHPAADIPCEVRDLRGLGEPEQKAALAAFVAQERARAFGEAADGPLLRVFVHLHDDGTWRCTFVKSHALLDGWSYHLLLGELVDAYERILSGHAGPEAETEARPEVRFADAIAAELAALDSAEDRAYWRDIVGGRSRLALPEAWRGDPALPPADVRSGLSFRDLEPRLRARAAEAGVSLKSVLLAAHLAVMSWITPEAEFHTGLVTHVRPEAAGAERILGMLLNTLPFPMDRTARTWRDLVRRVFDREAELWPHRHFPLPAIQREQGGGRITDVFFSYMDFDGVGSEQAEDEGNGINASATEFPLGVTVLGGILTLRTGTHTMAQEDADRLAGMYRAALESVARGLDGDPHAELLPADELDRLLTSGEGAAAVGARSVPELFEERAAASPEAPAVASGGESFTYAEVDERANRLARHLIGRGVGPESVVGVLLGRSVDLVVALLAVWKAGGAFVPLDPAYPANRVAAMLEDAGASLLVDASFLDAEAERVAAMPPTRPDRGSDPDRTAYVVFTSGSTGRPKGVQVTHRGLVNHVGWAASELPGGAAGGAPVFSSVAFDLQVPSLWAPLVSGRAVHLFPQDADLADLGKWLAEQGPFGFIKLTPSHLELLCHQLGADQARELTDTLVVAGEAFGRRTLESWRELAPDVRVLNEYGPTEASVGTCVFPVEGDVAGEVVPIGRPLPGMTMRVLDADMRLVPVGVVGELFVGGVGVARGYAGRADLTAERFVPDPFAAGARLYRTGDLVRMLPDGSVEFLGRLDDQVKIRGHRIEPGEVRAVVTEHPGVAEAVVVARDDRLVAYVVAGGDIADLRGHCAESLPDYMVPAVFVELAAIPLNANGKVDRHALPEPDGAPEDEAVIAPRTPAEERIAAVFAEVLGRPRVGLHDGFFESGGDSISAIVVVGTLRDEGYDVSVRDLFVSRTVAGLAEAAAGRGAAAGAERPVEPFELLGPDDRAALPAGVRDAYPMSQAQVGMLVEMMGGEGHYLSFAAYRIPDPRPFDEDALRAAAQVVVDRHEVLRSSLDLASYSVPMQVVHEAVEVPVTARDLRGLPEDEREAALMDLFTAARNEPIDLGAAPLLRLGAYVADGEGWWLAVARPHAVTEGWSHNALLAELLDCYRRVRDGREPAPYEAPPVRFADFIAAELAALDSGEDRAYWQAIVDGHAPVALPDGWGPGPETGPGEPFDVRVELGALEGPLNALAARARVSIKSVLLAAHVKVMSQLTDARAFHVGLICDARPEVLGADRVYGMHLNTVPFAMDRTAGTWYELVRRVFDREAELWPHRRYPMPAMQRAWGGGRLVNVVFNYFDFPRTAPDEAGGQAGGADLRLGDSRTEFGLTVHCRPDRLSLSTDTGVLSRANGERLAGMYRAVLAAMAADADGDARAAYLGPDEPEPPQDEGAATVREPVAIRAPAEFERHAAATPDAVAVHAAGVSLGYAELNDRADRLAHRLRELGAGPETLVGICADRSAELVLGVLAVLKAGGAYLPLDPELPPERLAGIAADAGLELLLTRGDLLAAAAPRDGRTVVLLDEPDQWPRPAADAPVPVADGAHLGYVIYTSGSTGRPKGAMVHRRGMGNHLLAKIEDLGLTAADTVVLNASPAFDISVWQMLAPLVTGGRVRVVDAATALDPERLFGLVADDRVTVLEVVPSLLRAALDTWDAGAPAPALPDLRWLVVTGEALPPELCARWSARYRGVPVMNAYGPTECSDDVTHAVITAEDDTSAEVRVPIGRAVRNTRLYVLDEWLQPVPAGVPGELHVGGAGVGRGYLDRPDLTAASFVPDPYGPAGARLYRTGDLARRLPDGSLDFLGRLDDQVKVRGHRIELGEIEAALAADPRVRQCVVVVRDERLIAYLVAEEGAGPDPAGLRSELARTLPDYMVPAAFVAMDRLPLTPNGKLDRRALPAPGEGDFARGEHVAPRTGLERRVADAWRRALDADRVGVDDGFFDLGGDSIRAVALVGALRAEGLDVAVRDVFEYRTVARLCEALRGRDRLTGDERAAVAPFQLISEQDRAALPDGVADAYPLTRNQIGMLVEMLADDGHRAYHIINTFRIRDERPVDADALAAAARTLAARHDILRTSIHLTGYSVPMQLVHDPRDAAGIRVGVQDLRGVPDVTGAAGERILREFVAAERADAFDLETAPLIRMFAHQESDEAWWLTFTQAHVITEGWSYHLLLMELLEVYHRIRDGLEPEPFEAPGVRFADSVAAELASLDSAEDRGYWRRITAEYAPLALPADWATAAAGPAAGPGTADVEPVYAQVPFEDLGDGLRALATAAGVSLKAVLLSAHLKVMSQITGAPAFHTGLVCDTRPEELGADRVYGMYLNTVPFAVDRGARTWGDLVRRTFDREVELWPHRRYPMPDIQREWGGGRLINVYFNYLDFHQVDTDAVDTGRRISNAPVEPGIGLTVHNRGDRLYLSTHTGAIGHAAAERLAGMYRAVLEAMAAGVDGDARAMYLPERAAEDIAEGAPEGAVAGCLHELFAEQAARTPDAPAVTAGGVTLTYAEVDARADRLARRLRSLGAGPERLVGVCLGRGADLLPALLGVLRSGAGYLPLDPANPADRLRYIVADAGVDLLVTDEARTGLAQAIHGGRLVVLGGPAASAGSADPADQDGPVAAGTAAVPGNLAYTIYTSGSTGRPKGVAVTHANVVRLMTTAQEHYAFDDSDVVSMSHSYAFDVSVFEMWAALLHGARLVLVPADVARSPEDFLDLLVDEEVTVLSQTPTAFRSLVAAAAAGDPRIRALALRAVVFAGERLDIPELRPWVERRSLARTALVNMYGITETTVHTTYYRITKRDLDPAAGNGVGRPLSDLRVHLLDAEGNRVPNGVAGEIHVAGPGVARGYLGRPDLTAQRFVPDPFGAPGSRMYRSGDTAVRKDDGTLEFAGRIDDQVKIRGFRVELGEIEAALAAHPAVEHAVVLLRDDERGEPALVGYVVPAGEERPDAADLRDRLAETLPEYMVPAVFVALDDLPLTPNGKLDKRALPAPGAAALRARRAYVAPRTALEQRIASVWSAVLGVAGVGVEDGFFDLGGDSIRAVSLVGALRAEGLDVGVPDVFARRTVAGLAQALEGRAEIHESATRVAPFELIADRDRDRLPAGVADAYPLTQGQAGMLVEMLSNTGQPNYHIVKTVGFSAAEPFDEDALRRAMDELVSRHEILRTSIDLERYSEPLQLVHREARMRLRVVDGRDLGEDAERAVLAAHVEAEAGEPLDHESAPLMRLTVHRLAGGRWQLTFAQSHAILDGWSFYLLRVQALELYRAYRDGREPEPYTAPDVRFADFVAAERAALAGDRDRGYWRAALDGAAKFTFPDGWGSASAGPGEVHLHQVRFGDLMDGIEHLAHGAGVPVKSVLLAAHLKVMSQLTREHRFVTGLMCHSRAQVIGADRVAGMSLNALPFVMDRTAATWRDLVTGVFAAEARMWEHRHFPMSAIQHDLAGGERLIDVYFSYIDFDQPEEGPVDRRLDFCFSSNEFPLTVAVQAARLTFHTNSRVLSPENAERLAGMYRAVLAAMAADPDGDARRIHLPQGEDEILHRAATGRVADHGTLSVPERIAEQAARTPGARAVVRGGDALTYAGLIERADAFAAALRTAGAGPGTVVGVLLDRDTDLIAGLLGVWRAGAAYLPLDPSHPAARLGEALTDAGAVALLSSDALAGPIGADFAGAVLAVDRIDAAPARAAASRPHPDETAYVIYTSGSTGRPKGVQVTHGGLANHLGWAAAELAGRGRGGSAVFSSVAFDLVVPNLWAPLLTGGEVRLLPPDLELTRLGEELLRHAPFGFLKLTPGHLEILSRQLTPEQATGLAEVIVVAGEALPAGLAGEWLDRVGPGRLVNEYGPTETSVGATVHPVAGPADGEVVPIGLPLPGVRTHVLDEDLREVPIGVAGELLVGGAGVARGYLDRPALTAERFVPDPFGPAGSRLYRTGDLVRLRPDGAAEFLGRLDHQVKIRGHRVEPGAVAALLTAHPAVREAAVVADRTGAGDARLVAYVVTGGDADPAGGADLAAYCAAELPAPMAPAVIVPLDALPLNANGKLDRAALPPAEARPDRPHVEPATATERRLAEIWAGALKVERVGRDDGFFDLGGHSILLIQVVLEAVQAGLPVTLLMFYQHETLRELAAAIDALPRPEPEPRHGSRRAAPAPAAVERGPLPGNVPGLSAAILQNGELVALETRGVLAAGGNDPVTADACFQGGSMSKHVTAFGALRLVDQGVLDLDEDVAAYLTGWRLPGGARVTVRHLLAHLSGLAPNPGKGYPRGGPVPTLLDVLNGRPPAANPPVTVDAEPGAVFRKANVHYSVLQQVMTDVTGRPFPDLMRELVLEPVGMTGSGFEHSFPEEPGRRAARGHGAAGEPVDGGWLVRPDAAAAGLWTTAADLARLALEIRRSHLGRPLAPLSPETAREMLTVQHEGAFYGLGTVVDPTGADPQFGHGGEPVGYHGLTVLRLGAGTGAVVLTNGSGGREAVRELMSRADPGTAPLDY